MVDVDPEVLGPGNLLDPVLLLALVVPEHLEGVSTEGFIFFIALCCCVELVFAVAVAGGGLGPRPLPGPPMRTCATVRYLMSVLLNWTVVAVCVDVVVGDVVGDVVGVSSVVVVVDVVVECWLDGGAVVTGPTVVGPLKLCVGVGMGVGVSVVVGVGVVAIVVVVVGASLGVTDVVDAVVSW